MQTKSPLLLKYLTGYAPDILTRVRQLVEQDRLGRLLQSRYGELHDVRTDRALYDYVMDLKTTYMRQGERINKVAYDSKIEVVAHALGQHTRISRLQGSRLKAKHEIRIATLFRNAPLPFLKMIVVHELAHLKEHEHNKAFYQLCERMEANYHQLEFDLRLYLTYRDLPQARDLWDRPAQHDSARLTQATH